MLTPLALIIPSMLERMELCKLKLHHPLRVSKKSPCCVNCFDWGGCFVFLQCRPHWVLMPSASIQMHLSQTSRFWILSSCLIISKQNKGEKQIAQTDIASQEKKKKKKNIQIFQKCSGPNLKPAFIAWWNYSLLTQWSNILYGIDEGTLRALRQKKFIFMGGYTQTLVMIEKPWERKMAKKQTLHSALTSNP